MDQFGDNDGMDDRAKMDIMMKMMIEMKDRMDKQDREREKEKKEKESANNRHIVPKRKKSWNNSDHSEASTSKKSRKNESNVLSDNRRFSVSEEVAQTPSHSNLSKNDKADSDNDASLSKDDKAAKDDANLPKNDKAEESNRIASNRSTVKVGGNRSLTKYSEKDSSKANESSSSDDEISDEGNDDESVNDYGGSKSFDDDYGELPYDGADPDENEDGVCNEENLNMYYQDQREGEEDNESDESDESEYDDFDPLESFKKKIEDDEEYSEAIDPGLAKVLTKTVKKRQKSKKTKAEIEKIKLPKNLKMLQTPRCNRAMWSRMSKRTREANTNITRISEVNSKALISQAKMLEKLRESTQRMKKVIEEKGIIEKKDAAKIIGQFKEVEKMGLDTFNITATTLQECNQRRRNNIKNDLPLPLKQVCNPPKKEGKMLFPEGVEDEIKNITNERNASRKFGGENFLGGMTLSRQRGNYQKRGGLRGSHSHSHSNFGTRGRGNHHPSQNPGNYQRGRGNFKRR